MAEKEVKLMKGNEVIAHAAIRYGCDGYFGYPITPQSEVMETLMELKPWETTGMVVLQAESEISSINMVYGGASTGKRVMTSSSSPGISLMSEGLSYLAGAELPCVIVNCMRGGPGLGDIGPEAGMPVMEGKCVLFKAFGDVDAFPLCVRTHDVDEFVNTVALISGSFGGINLEDISAPRCFEIERKLKERCDIPIFHDDQHGTAVITLAGLTNALKVVGKKKEDVRIVTSGAGAAAIAIVKLLLSAGFRNVTMCDRKGAIYKGREGLNWIKEEMAEVTNLKRRAGSLADMLVGADVFIGVSAPGAVTTEMVKTMNKDAIVFACANPTPEIFPEDAKAGGARIVSTGRSDYPNQINNVLAFPGIFRGAFDVRASDINEEMKVAAAEALAGLAGDELSEDYIIPAAFDPRVGPAVAKAVAEAARRSGVARM